VSAADTPLSARVAGFVAHLRENGLQVGPAETETALRVVARGEAPTLDRVRRTLKILLTGRRSEWERFDDLFEAYWVARGRLRRVARRPARAASPPPTAARLWSDRLGEAGARAQASGEGEVDAADGDSDGSRSMRAASARHALRRADLRHVVDREEMARAEQVAYRLARALRYRLSRRYRVARRGRRVDLRRTIRRSLAHGGDPLSLVHRARPDRPVRVVLMLDVSGSMQPYSRYLLQFVKGLVASWPQADAYLFNTRLTRITEVLREKDAMLAMGRLSLMAEGFGGGTRLSDCLAAFNDHYAKRALGSRSVFVMLSDGYDTGEPEQCVEQLARLKRRVRRLVWLNPMLGWERYEPVTRTMRAVLPYVDHFAPAHSLEALAALEAELGAV
jgi:uncharacterized protein with von Willebrand factor type A (vWA) domain